ncbi:hypothetical protein [Acrocarpospora sp. B8E8]|uniref:tetratricopeptide repeat protein n=1 Tax=Acrocarpospora sp. B8E8 TaxID=3153572 RepID=UPI00325FA96C
MDLLRKAETTLAINPTNPISQWVNNFDEGSFASEAVRCMLLLGDYSEAQRQAERIVELRPAERMRSRAFGKLALSRIFIQRGDFDEACAVAQEVLDCNHSHLLILVSPV